MKLTEAQKEAVNQIQNHLIWQIGDREVTVEHTAAAMMELCENLDYDMAVLTCQRIWHGAGELYQLCREKDALAEPDYVEHMLDRITEQMNREQRKGFFLLALHSFEKDPASPAETAARAARTEEELKKMLSNRIQAFSEAVIAEMAEVIEEPCFQWQDRDASLKQRVAKEDAFLFAVAVYLAGLNGVLPQEFGEYPELLGICSAMQVVFFQLNENGEEVWRNSWMLPDMVSGVICAAFGASLMLGSAVAGIAADSVLFAMELSQLGFLISVFSSAALYIWFVMGSLMFVGGIGTVLGLCMEKIQKKQRESKTEMVFSEKNGTVETGAGWQNQSELEEEQERARVVPNGV